MSRNVRRKLQLTASLLWLALANACSTDMSRQPHYHRPLEPSRLFPDGRSSRPPLEGTVARGQLQTDSAQGVEAAEIPVPVTRQLLLRGQERFNAICTPCHGRLGDGRGMIVRRGFSQPPSFHMDRLRQVPDGHFFDVITNGRGRMWSYASRVAPPDRWAIAAYIRALQLSQAATLEDVPEAERGKLRGEQK
jgi:mono/diheme cytochrome c family protein